MAAHPNRTNTMTDDYYKQQHRRLDNFAKELADLSRRHGITVKSVGGVWVADDIALCANVYYDIGNQGDLLPDSPDWPD